MNRLKRLLRPLGLALCAIGALVILGFVDHTTSSAPIPEVKVRVLGGEGMHFIDEQGVRTELIGQGSAVVGAASDKWTSLGWSSAFAPFHAWPMGRSITI